MSSVDWQSLKDAAVKARAAAYCPYSGYAVGAAVLGSRGTVFSGCNVENISYGASLCAERNAVAQMVASGDHELCALVVVTKDGGSPCGICLQVLAEFAADPALMPILILSETGAEQVTELGRLFPQPFTSKEVRSL